MSNYTIATIFSFITACFTMAASWTKSPKRSYLFQVAQCLVYGVASYFYGVYPCIVMMVINAARNLLVAYDRYKKAHCVVFTVLAVVLGLWSNTTGVVGLITVLGTVQYSVCSYLLKKEVSVKLNIIINLVIWIVYDVLIVDFFSAGMDLMGVTLAVVTIFRIKNGEKEKQPVKEIPEGKE